MWSMHGVGWGWWLLMSIGIVAFWALIIYGIVWLARGRPTDRSEQAAAESPEKTLQRRLAQGEISLDEYERLDAAIHGPPREPASAEDGQPTAGVR